MPPLRHSAYLRSTLNSHSVITDVACTLCGCVCDDLRISVQENRIVRAEGACEIAEPWLLEQNTRWPPATRIAGQAVSWEEAIGRAGDILRSSLAPLIYGLSHSSTAGQRAAAHLADCLGATIDTAASHRHAPSIMALQQVGESTCSLGEVKNRCDLVVFWGANPVKSHPRHLERYSVEPRGLFTPQGRQDRFVIVVDVRHSETAEKADWFIQVEPNGDFEILWALRTLIAGEAISSAVGGVSSDTLRTLAERLQTCRSGIVFFGPGLTRHGAPHASVEAMLRLVKDLNKTTRFYARSMRPPGDAAGANNVLCWSTGFPFAVNLARGYPRYNPGEYFANDVLERGEADSCLIVVSESIAQLSEKAQRRLEQIPTIVLDYPHTTCSLVPTVAFTTAVYGVHLPGTAYRMDETPIPLRPVLSCEYPSDSDVLEAIRAEVVRR